jgi:hypothetical protein
MTQASSQDGGTDSRDNPDIATAIVMPDPETVHGGAVSIAMHHYDQVKLSGFVWIVRHCRQCLRRTSAIGREIGI